MKRNQISNRKELITTIATTLCVVAIRNNPELLNYNYLKKHLGSLADIFIDTLIENEKEITSIITTSTPIVTSLFYYKKNIENTIKKTIDHLIESYEPITGIKNLKPRSTTTQIKNNVKPLINDNNKELISKL